MTWHIESTEDGSTWKRKTGLGDFPSQDRAIWSAIGYLREPAPNVRWNRVTHQIAENQLRNGLPIFLADYGRGVRVIEHPETVADKDQSPMPYVFMLVDDHRIIRDLENRTQKLRERLERNVGKLSPEDRKDYERQIAEQ